MGRPWPHPGEPLFLEEDTAAFIALGEEERDTCPVCGMPKAWCRDVDNQYAFDVKESTCWATQRLAQHRNTDGWKAKHDDTKQAIQLVPRFRDGHSPALDAGLDFD